MSTTPHPTSDAATRAAAGTTTAPAPLVIETPEDLRRAMGTEHTPSPQQWAAISAPLAPAVVVAGAGSGKTTLMAARVVHIEPGRVAALRVHLAFDVPCPDDVYQLAIDGPRRAPKPQNGRRSD